MKHLIVLFVAAIIFSCSSSTTIPTQTNTNKATNNSDSTEALLEGKKLYEANCGTCHKLYKPTSQSEEGWKHEVPEMSIKVNRKAGTEVLDAKKQEMILKYLITASNQK